MPQRTVRIAHEYAQRQVQVGEAFEVASEHVALWLTLGRIEPEAGEPGYLARDMTASEAPGYLTRALVAAKPRGRPRKVQAQ